MCTITGQVSHVVREPMCCALSKRGGSPGRGQSWPSHLAKQQDWGPRLFISSLWPLPTPQPLLSAPLSRPSLAVGLPRANSGQASPWLAAPAQRGCTHIPWLLSSPQELRKQSPVTVRAEQRLPKGRKQRGATERRPLSTPRCWASWGARPSWA